jgi:hypothetical protein
VGRGGDLEHAVAAGLELGAHEVGELAGLRDVDLVQGHEARALVEGDRSPAVEPAVHRVVRELRLDGLEVGDRVPAGLEGRAVQHVHQRGAALDVAQELQAQALALGGARDQPGDVGHGVAHVPGLDHAEVGHERREGVVGDLGPGGADGRDQARLPGGGVPHQGHVGDGLELQHDVPGVPGRAQQGEAGGLALDRGQRRVAQAALAAGGRDELRTLAHEVGQDVAVLVLDHGAVRHGEDEVLPLVAVAHVALAGPAVLGRAVGGVVVVEQGGGLPVHAQDHAAPVAPVAAVRAAERLELLAEDGHAAVPAGTAGDVQDDAVYETGHGGLL